jgi:hypothetical protein
LRAITIHSSDESENASDLIRVNCEFDSREMVENDSRNEKHEEPRTVISRGI